MSDDIRSLLEQVKNGQVDVDAALLKLKMKPIEDLGYANVDLHISRMLISATLVICLRRKQSQV